MGIFVDWLIPSKNQEVEQLAFDLDAKFSIDVNQIMHNKRKSENKLSYTRYFWSTIEDIAKDIFSDGKHEFCWAEDMWNVLMFNDVVKYENLFKPSYGKRERGDIILWLIAMYNLYYEFKVASGLCKLINYDYFDGVYFIEDSMKAIGEYLSESIMKEVNNKIAKGRILKYEVFDMENQCFNFEPGAIAYNLCIKEVSERRKIITDALNKYCNGPMEILRFMEGVHWCENYFNYKEREEEILSWYEDIKAHIKRGLSVTYRRGDNQFEYVEEEDTIDDMEGELKALRCEMNESILEGNEINRLMWLDNDMKF